MVVGSHPHPEEVASGAAEGRDVPAPSVMSFMSFMRGMEGDTNQRLDGRLLASPNHYMSPWPLAAGGVVSCVGWGPVRVGKRAAV